MYKCLPQIDNGLCTQYTVLLSERCVNFFAREATYTCKTNTDITYTCTLHFSKSLNLLYMYKRVFKKRRRYDNYHFWPIFDKYSNERQDKYLYTGGRIYSLLFSILMELFEIKSRTFLFVKNRVDICLDEISFEIYIYILTPRYLQSRIQYRRAGRAPPGLNKKLGGIFLQSWTV